MLRHPTLRLAGLAACAGLLAGCDEEGPDIDVESAIPVRVQPVTRGPVAEYVAATATVEAAREDLLACEEAGRYRPQTNPRTGAPWAMGDRVEAGDLIARLENAEFENQVSIESKVLQQASARREHDKQKGLFEHGGITLRELTDAERAAIDARYALENARLQLARLEVRAPFAGVLVDLEHHGPGQRLRAGDRIGKVMEYAELYAEASLPGKEMGRVAPGQEALVTHYGAADDTLRGRVTQVSPVIDAGSRTFKAALAIDNPDRRLRPGMFVRIELVAAARDSALVIPRDVIIDRGHEKVVFVVEKGIAARRRVETGLGNRERVEVLSGLMDGERLVVEGFETLRDRSRVKTTN